MARPEHRCRLLPVRCLTTYAAIRNARAVGKISRMTFTKRGLWLRPLLVALAAGLLLWRLGPFDTFSDLRAGERLGYWVGLTLLLAIQILAVLGLIRSWQVNWHWTIAAAVAGIVAAIPSAFEVAWAEDLLRVERDLGPVDLLAIYGDVVLLAVPLAIAMTAAVPKSVSRADSASAPNSDRLLAALPVERRGALLAVTAEDHYLRVHTEVGDSLILRRFGDAMEELAGLDGLQVHRSWWVSRQAVSSVEREGERVLLVLTNGLRVPVSRTFLRQVREAGLIGRC